MTEPDALPQVPTISVVIVSRNEGSNLLDTVNNIVATLRPFPSDIIVVDDGSTDDSAAPLARFEDVRVIHTSGLGVAGARNAGASAARGDILLFADAHIQAPEGWREHVIGALRNRAVGAVAPGIYNTAAPAQRGFGLDLTGPDLRTQWRQHPGDGPRAVPVLPGCFLAMRRDTFLRSGGFDSGMRQLGGNDGEISCRLWMLGYELLVLPDIEVGHVFRKQAPYQASWVSVVHNRLRMALVHFRPDRVERVVAALRGYEAFPAAIGMMVGTDVFARRESILGLRRFDDEWFFDKFGNKC